MSDDDMRPNAVGWESDMPGALTQALASHDLTKLKHGTSIAFGMQNSLSPLNVGVTFCPSPKRHAHVEMSRSTTLSHASVVAVFSYTLALALDRADWITDVPSEAQVIDAWEDVLAVVKGEHEGFALFLLLHAQVGGLLGDPVEWAMRYKQSVCEGSEAEADAAAVALRSGVN